MKYFDDYTAFIHSDKEVLYVSGTDPAKKYLRGINLKWANIQDVEVSVEKEKEVVIRLKTGNKKDVEDMFDVSAKNFKKHKLPKVVEDIIMGRRVIK